MIKRWKPWECSTGPTSHEGKEACMVNARKHGLRSKEWRALMQALRDQKDALEEMRTD